MNIRRMTLEDIPRICEIEKACFSDPWSAASFESVLSKKDEVVYVVAEIDGVVVGHMGVWYILDEGHITNVAVAPEARRQGVGRALVTESIVRGLKAGIVGFTLEVRVDNQAAIALYESFDFEVAGRRKNYYGQNQDALIMWVWFKD